MDSTYFETRYVPHPGRSRVWRAICEYLQPFIEPSSVVMDVGAGYCVLIDGRSYSRELPAANGSCSSWS